jgi:hypothetical protein
MTRLNLEGDRADLAACLAEDGAGLHVLLDAPQQFRPPLTEVLKGRLWVEVARPGRSSQQENILIEAGSRVGARPVASLAARFALPGGYNTHNTFRLDRILGGVAFQAAKALTGLTVERH